MLIMMIVINRRIAMETRINQVDPSRTQRPYLRHTQMTPNHQLMDPALEVGWEGSGVAGVGMLSGLMLGRVGLGGELISWLRPHISGDQSLVRTNLTPEIALC